MTIETGRLRLRPWQIDDFDRLHALTASEEMHRYLGGAASIEDDYRRLLAAIGGWTTFGFDRFTIRERDGDAFVGTCGLFRLNRGLGDGFDGHPEAGWIVASDRWGRGYAGEAMQAAIDWFDAAHGKCRTVCMIAAENTASAKIAAKLGYRHLRIAEHKGEPVNLYARDPQ